MRTLKKALCLVLVLAMVLSLGVSAFAVDKALDYKDYGTVTNKEAVDVLTALSVIHGNDDGTFGPAGNFTRAQAATMITYLMLGTTTANALPTTATQFNDVPASHWAAKYVQYCANDKIINGYGDGKFGPDDKLTNTQWALMLLGALGYKASNEQIGGSGWEIQVTKLAMSAGIANADDFAATFNRDMAAKMALNTLKAAVVEYDSNGQTITVTGDSSTTTINTGATKAKKVTQAASGTADRLGNTDYYQFGEQHFSKLVMEKGTTDPAGRPAHEWRLNNKSVGEYPDAATLTYVNSFTGKTVKDLQKQGYKFGTTTDVFYNGGEGVLALTDLYNGEKSAVNGYTIEIFADEDKNVSDVVVTEAYFAQVQKFTAATSTKEANVKLTVWEHNQAAGKTMTITNDPDVDNDIYDKIAAAYEAKDYLLVYCNPGWETKAATAEEVIFDAAAVTTVEGQITRFTNNGKISTSTVAMDGSTYNLANEFVTPGNASGATNAATVASTLAAKNKGTLYLDANNSVVAYMGEASTGDKAILVTSTYTTLENGKLTYKASGITSNGETTELTVQALPVIGNVYTYTYVSADDNYTMALAGSEAAPSASNKDQAIAITSSAAIAKTTRAMSVGGTSTYFANDVKFVFWNSTNKTATVKTGVQPVAAGKVSAVAVRDNGNGGYYITAVYVNAAPADEGVTSADIIYIAKAGATGSILVDGQSKPIQNYDAYVNGEKIDGFYSTDLGVAAGYYKSAKNETTGAYLLTGYAHTNTTAATMLNKTTVTAYDSTLQILNGTYSLDGAVIVDLTAAGDGITTSPAVSVTALYNAETNVASVVYVID